MIPSEAKRYIKDHLEDYLRNKGIDTRRPFRCLNPSHEDRHPSMSLDHSSPSGPHCKCFSCGAYYDTFDIIGIDYGLTDEGSIFETAYEIFWPEGKSSSAGHAAGMEPKPDHSTEGNDETAQGNKLDGAGKPSPDFTAAAEAAHRELLGNPDALEHFIRRGLSMDIIKKYRLGYDHEGYNHMVADFPELRSYSRKESLYRYIFPYPDKDGKYTYFLSEIEDRSQADAYNDKYRKINRGSADLPARLFNERYLICDTPSTIFICEGIYDALSVEDAGGNAIALTGTGYGRLINLCRRFSPQTMFVLSMDNDEAGRAASVKIAEGLEKAGMQFITAFPQGAKDFNEALQKDREGFTEYIRNVISENRAERDSREALEKLEYFKTSAQYRIKGFLEDIKRSRTAVFYPTGFEDVDGLLDGGLYPGLYFIGALSSLGKTTFCLQAADNIAASGNDVIVFSLEMSAKELIAKSVSRLSAIRSIGLYGTADKAKTVRDILTGSRYAAYSEEDRDIIVQSVREYSRIAQHMFLNEGVGDIGAEQIRDTIEKHIRITGRHPVVVIDYIQILSPYNARYTDKQNTDKAVLELKRMSRDFDIPVIGISSFNRENYNSPVNLASFKESGAIEYTSDVLIGLQYYGMDYTDEDTDAKTRQKRIRELLDETARRGKEGGTQRIQFKILKNRNGSKGDAVLDYIPKYNYFSDHDTYWD